MIISPQPSNQEYQTTAAQDLERLWFSMLTLKMGRKLRHGRQSVRDARRVYGGERVARRGNRDLRALIFGVTGMVFSWIYYQFL